MMPQEARSALPTACYALLAEAEPGVLARVIGTLAKRGLVPAAVQARRVGGDRLAIDLQLEDMDSDLAALIAEQLRAVVAVERVLLAELPEAIRVGARV